jgi:hypothetical protein
VISIDLQRRLRERRHASALKECLQILGSVGIDASAEDALPLLEVDRIWSRYLEELRARSLEALHYPGGEAVALNEHLRALAERLGDERVAWLALADSEPVGVDVPANKMLQSAMAFFVTKAGDLMLSTRDARSGICVESNHLGHGDEYELVEWGAFASAAPPGASP